MKETILLFNITDRNTKLKLERILLPLKLRIRRIPVSQYGQTLAALCGLEEPADLPSESAVTTSFSDPMMIFAGLSEMTLNRVLAGLRAQQIRIPLQSYSDLHQSALDTGGMFYRDQKKNTNRCMA